MAERGRARQWPHLLLLQELLLVRSPVPLWSGAGDVGDVEAGSAGVLLPRRHREALLHHTAAHTPKFRPVVSRLVT